MDKNDDNKNEIFIGFTNLHIFKQRRIIMKITPKQMTLVSLFAALTAIGAYIQIPIGTIPITLQVLFTALAGVMLGAKLGALSQLIYVIIGLIGIPVFAGGIGGFTAVSKPSFGFLIGFILAAYVIGKITEHSKKPTLIRLFLASVIGIVVIYIIGIPYLYFIINNIMGKKITILAALKSYCFIFIPGDLLKCILTAAIGIKVVPIVRKSMNQ
jgi:biotin transport system substrate-specific component